MTVFTSAQATAAPVHHRARRWSWLWVLLAGTLLYLLVLRTLVRTENLNFFPSLLLLGSVVVPAAVLTFADSRQESTLAPPQLVAFVAVMGGIVGTVSAGSLEYGALERLNVLPMFLVGLIEEAVKLIVPILVLIFTRYRDPRAGVIFGVASGMGFATLETMGYGFNALLSTRSIAGVEDTLLLRALLSPAGHVAWTGLTVAALWAVVSSARKGRAVARLVGTFVAAVLLHAAWDGVDNVWVHVVVGVVSFVALLLVIHHSHKPTHPHAAAAIGSPRLTEPAPLANAQPPRA